MFVSSKTSPSVSRDRDPNISATLPASDPRSNERPSLECNNLNSSEVRLGPELPEEETESVRSCCGGVETELLLPPLRFKGEAKGGELRSGSFLPPLEECRSRESSEATAIQLLTGNLSTSSFDYT